MLFFGKHQQICINKHNIYQDTPHFLYSGGGGAGSLIYTLWMCGNESVNVLLKTPSIGAETREIRTGVFVKHECPRWQQSPKMAIFSIKVPVKVTGPLILVSFERVALVEYACQIWSMYLLVFKSNGQCLGLFCHKVTEPQTDRTKSRCPGIPFWGHKNGLYIQNIVD